MNADRRHIGEVCIRLISECAELGEMSEDSHVALVKAVKHIRSEEWWQLKNQEKHEGKNASTDHQIGISRKALPALEAAVEALEKEDYSEVIDRITLAITTGLDPVRKTPKKRLRSKSK